MSMTTTANSAIPFGKPGKRQTIDEIADIIGDDLSDVVGHAAGVIFADPEGHVLLLKRAPTEKNYGEHWGLPSGKAEDGETPEEAATREAHEELGGTAPAGRKALVASVRTPNNMAFHTFAQRVPEQFTPNLKDGEHTEHMWAKPDALPEPLHPQVKKILSRQASDGAESEWWRATERERDRRESAGRHNEIMSALRTGTPMWNGWGSEEGEGAEGADAEFNEGDHPRAPDGKFGSGGGTHSPSRAATKSLHSMGFKTASGPGLATKIKTHGAAIAKHGKAAVEFVRSEGAAGVLSKVAENEKLKHAGKEALSFTLQSLLSHGTGVFHHIGLPIESVQGLDPSTWKLNEDLVEHAMGHFAAVAGIAKDKAKTTLRKGVEALIAQREAMKAGKTMTQAHDEDGEDGVMVALKALHDLLSEDEDEGGATDARPAEHRLVIEFSGDFNMAKFIQHLHRLGAIGASRTITAVDEDDNAVSFGWDGDGADKIVSAELDGDDILSRKALAATDSALVMALDRDTVRDVDRDGRLRVAVTNISKATVNPYRGKEINDVMRLDPNWVMLDDNKIYFLLRCPEELKKAAPTFNGVQVLRKHIPLSADDHQPWETVGATGTDAEFVEPYLRNSMTIWAKDAIDDIENDQKKELSCGYHYRAVMEPGVYNGMQYDGKMVDLIGNHVALVQSGRAGPDVVVGDSYDEILWEQVEDGITSLGQEKTNKI